MNKIPFLIHQTWKDENIPERLLPLVQSWKTHHLQWNYKLWTDDMNREFIQNNYPDFLDVYDNYPYNIQRVDAVRYFILLKHGGLFVDLDFQCIKNILPLLINNSCIFGLEPPEHCRQQGKEKIICNAFMACQPGNDFMKKVCETLKNNITDNSFHRLHPSVQIIYSTGPLKLTEIYDEYGDKDSVKLISSDLLYPLWTQETTEIITKNQIEKKSSQEKINNAYAVHYFMASWWTDNGF